MNQIKIEISPEQVYAIMAETLIRDYKHLRDGEDYEGDKTILLASFRVVLRYLTTEQQRKEAGI